MRLTPILTLPVLLTALAACSEPAPSVDAPGGPSTDTSTAPAPLPSDQADPAPDADDPSPEEEAGTPDAPAPPAPDPDGEQGGTDDWRQLISREDRGRLNRLDRAWRQALREARDKGFGEQVRPLGALADPDAGQTAAAPPSPGAYRCRTIKIGSSDGAGLGYLEYPWFRCAVELTPGGDLILTKTTGSQRTRGLIYPDDEHGFVFLGAQAWGLDEQGYPAYNQQPERNQVGVLERLGANRWRLVIPFPRTDGKVDLLELTR